MSISKRDCIAASVLVLENAQSLKRDAELLAENNSYGRAISLLIHSLEEEIKSLVLFLDGHGFQFRKRVKGINGFFVNHNLRYALSMIFFGN